MEANDPENFGVIAEISNYDHELVMLDLSFARLMDDVVVPYKTDEMFFIDGVPASNKSVRRIKIIQYGAMYREKFDSLERGMTRGSAADKKCSEINTK